MIRFGTSRVLLFATALVFLPAIAGCDSTTAPKFPDPIEEPEDSTPEEGMTRRWGLVPGALDAGELETRTMPFTYASVETT